jgi:hypothetical protein
MELALYDLSVKRELRKAFAEDPARALQGYRLSEEEAALIRGFDVRGMQARGVNPLVTFGFWMMNAGERTSAAYLAKLRS